MQQAENDNTTPEPEALDGRDAALLRVAERFHGTCRALSEKLRQNLDYPGAIFDLCEAERRRRSLARRMAEMIATTPEGWKAKASVIIAVARIDLDGEVSCDSACELLGVSLSRDLLGPFYGLGEVAS